MATQNLFAVPILLILVAAHGFTALETPTIGGTPGKNEIRELYPMSRIGYDKSGSAVYLKEIGKWNMGKLAAMPKEKQDEFWKYFEKLVRKQERDAKRYSDGKGNTVIYDFDGFRFNHNIPPEARKLLRQQLTFIDREGKATNKGFIINVSDEVKQFAKLTGAGPYLKDYLAKFEIFEGPKANQWKARLLEEIPANQLPAKYGGSKIRIIPRHS